MKRFYIIGIFFCFIQISTLSQKSQENYVRVLTMLHETDTTQYLDNIQYYDGLGRPFLAVQKGITPNHSNLLTLQEYDALGRESAVWLPHVTSTDFLSPAPYKNLVSTTYGGETCPYSKPVYESSPLNRLIRKYSPGVAWSLHPDSVAYLTNTATGKLQCKLYEISSSGALAQNKNYVSGELFVTKQVDADGNVSYAFVDKLERQVLVRQMEGSTPYDTYYVYDDFDNLCFVLPPAYQDEPDLNLYAYRYKYDHRNRCVEKILPGCQPIKYVYDKADNLIFSQDGVQRTKSEWTFYIYDKFQRLVLKGVCTNGDTSSVADAVVQVEILRDQSQNHMILESGLDRTGYVPNITLILPKVYVVNYYDDYSFLNVNGFLGAKGVVDATGLLTGSIVRSFDDNIKICTVTHYDFESRPIRVIANNHLGGSEETITSYTFTGKPKVIIHIHKSTIGNAVKTLSEMYTYDYDHADRLIQIKHQLDEFAPRILTLNEYDELGRLKCKNQEGNSAVYSYNIRNWLTGIEYGEFIQKLYYETGEGIPCYNGNISSMNWQSGWEPTLRGYKFAYDGLSRLTSASYGEDSDLATNAGRYTENVSEYDKQGNIKHLQRYGKIFSTTYGLIDNLTIVHKGNQLLRVSDSADDPLYNGAFDFVDGANAEVEYTYDENGNLSSDLNKGISNIRYNMLNLPAEITDKYKGSIKYMYSADGVKRKEVGYAWVYKIVDPLIDYGIEPANTNLLTERESASNIPFFVKDISELAVKNTSLTETREAIKTLELDSVVVDYCGNIIYEKGEIKYILFDGGYITLRGASPFYHYYLKDHQGNNRVVFTELKTIEQVNHFYPFGGLFDSSTGGDAQPYKYGGKELDMFRGLSWYDFGARYLRSDIPSWTSIDPLCEKYYSISPYVYCLNNPLKYIDLKGDSVRVYTETQATGHTWISVGEGDNMTVYSYGRYNGTNKGPDGSSNSLANGPGVLLKLTGDEAKVYNEEKATTGMSTFVITDVADETIATAMDKKFDSSTRTPDKGKYKENPSAHVIDEYSLVSNNCTTVVSDVLNNSGSNALKGMIFQQTSTFGTWTTVPVINKFVLPVSMQTYLTRISKPGGTVYKTR